MVSRSSFQRKAIDRSLATFPPGSAIQAIARGPDVEARLAQFEAADQTAIRNQARFRRSGRTALWATTIGTLIGALLLLPLDTWIAGFPRGVVAMLQTVALITTFIAIQWIGWRKPVDAWMTSRAEAERQRAEIFQAVIAAPNPAPGDGQGLPAAKLKLLTDAYIDEQLGYYDAAAQKHARAARRMTPFKLAGYLLTALAFALGGFTILNLLAANGFPMPVWLNGLAADLTVADASRWQLGMGTMASSLLAHASARSQMDQDDRNAALYARTAQNVRDFLAQSRPSAHAAAAAGDQAPLQSFFSQARGLLEVEHVAWFVSTPPQDPRQTPNHRLTRAAK